MSQFWIFFNLGLKHILDIYSYDHILFLLVLTIPFTIKEWIYLLIQITIFTIAHTLGLLLIITKVVAVKPEGVLAMIPIAILVTASFNFYKAGKSSKEGNYWISFMTFFYGIIHGLSFLNIFNEIMKSVSASSMSSLFQFNVGIWMGQIVFVLTVFLGAYISQTVLKFSRRELILICSAFVIGFVLPMILKDKIWLQ